MFHRINNKYFYKLFLFLMAQNYILKSFYQVTNRFYQTFCFRQFNAKSELVSKLIFLTLFGKSNPYFGFQAPPKGNTIPYRPKSNVNSLLLSNAAAVAIAAQQQALIAAALLQPYANSVPNSIDVSLFYKFVIFFFVPSICPQTIIR